MHTPAARTMEKTMDQAGAAENLIAEKVKQKKQEKDGKK